MEKSVLITYAEFVTVLAVLSALAIIGFSRDKPTNMLLIYKYLVVVSKPLKDVLEQRRLMYLPLRSIKVIGQYPNGSNIFVILVERIGKKGEVTRIWVKAVWVDCLYNKNGEACTNPLGWVEQAFYVPLTKDQRLNRRFANMLRGQFGGYPTHDNDHSGTCSKRLLYPSESLEEENEANRLQNIRVLGDLTCTSRKLSTGPLHKLPEFLLEHIKVFMGQIPPVSEKCKQSKH